VWVVVQASNEVVRFDARTAKVRARLPITPTPPRHLAVTRRGIWVGTGTPAGEPGVLLWYTRAGRLRQSLLVPNGIRALAAGRGAIWLTTRDTPTLARVVPGAAGAHTNATLAAFGRAVRYADGSLWVVLDAGDTVMRIDPRTGNKVTASAGRSPADMIVAGGRVLVTSRNDHTLVLLRPRSLLAAAEPIRVGLHPYAITADDDTVWITGLGDSTVTRVDFATG
jgi:streptogramin lyase